MVDNNGVVTLVADWTDKDEKLGRILEQMGSKQLPVLAIFPAGDPQKPFIFRGGYTSGSLIDRLKKAGPSRNVARVEAGQQLTSAGGE